MKSGKTLKQFIYIQKKEKKFQISPKKTKRTAPTYFFRILTYSGTYQTTIGPHAQNKEEKTFFKHLSIYQKNKKSPHSYQIIYLYYTPPPQKKSSRLT